VTIGLATAATSIVYFIFLLYFDWIREFYLPIWRQQIWILLHFPFHLALVLWQTCFAQFIIWSKIFYIWEKAEVDEWKYDTDFFETATSEQVSDKWEESVDASAKKYPLKWQQTITSIQEALTNITEIPEEFWPTWGAYLLTADESVIDQNLKKTYQTLTDVIDAGLQTCLFAAYDVDLLQEQYESKQLKNDTASWLDGTEQISLRDQTGARLDTVVSQCDPTSSTL
jgi:hypothetical protein